MARAVIVILLSALVLVGLAWWSRESDATRRSALQREPLEQTNGMRMEKFALRDTQRNQTRWEILADVALVDPQRDITTIEGVRLTLFSAKHGPVKVSAHHGIIQNQSKDMQVCGDVHLVVEQVFSLNTECLQWRAGEQALETDTPVMVQMEHLQAEGRGFRGVLAEERFEIQQQVRAQWSKR